MNWKNLPPATRRSFTYQDMTKAAQQAAIKIHKKLNIANKRDLLLKHAIGTRMNRAARNMAVYGQDCPDSVSFVLGFSEDCREVSAMMDFADQYPIQFILEESSKPMANGAFITYSHFLELLKFDSMKKRRQLLERVRTKGLTVTRLRRLIAAERRAGK